ncbi:MAG: YfaP family protein [Candidatus Neomarinimicrobiota bacterium]
MKNTLFIVLLSYALLIIASCESPNKPVQLISIQADRNFVWSGEPVKLFCNAVDLDSDKISYLWKAPAGQLSIVNDTAIWIAPDSVGYYHISCIVNDGNGTSDGDFLKILVVKGGALIEGLVKNAVTGLVEEDVNVSLNGLEVLSDNEGFYSVYVPDLLNSYILTGIGDEFCPYNGVVNIPSDYSSNVFEYNFSISPIPDVGEIRIILTWGSNPTDMDSHLLTPEIDSAYFHISYSNRGNNESAPYAVLDLDDVDGFGPETITIKQLETGIYTYYVHQYSNDGSLDESKGTIQIFDSPNCTGQTIDAPFEGEGRYWNVFKINGETGDILKINEIVETIPGS